MTRSVTVMKFKSEDEAYACGYRDRAFGYSGFIGSRIRVEPARHEAAYRAGWLEADLRASELKDPERARAVLRILIEAGAIKRPIRRTLMFRRRRNERMYEEDRARYLRTRPRVRLGRGGE